MIGLDILDGNPLPLGMSMPDNILLPNDLHPCPHYAPPILPPTLTNPRLSSAPKMKVNFGDSSSSPFLNGLGGLPGGPHVPGTYLRASVGSRSNGSRQGSIASRVGGGSALSRQQSAVSSALGLTPRYEID